jgi:hypothetical protein
MGKPVRRRRYRRYENKPESWFSSITIGQIKQWLMVMVPLVTSLWLFAGPYVNAKAEDLLKEKLVQIGMDPATVQALNKNLLELQETVKAKDGAVDKLSGDVGDLKVELGKVLILLQSQQQQMQAPVQEPAK